MYDSIFVQFLPALSTLKYITYNIHILILLRGRWEHRGQILYVHTVQYAYRVKTTQIGQQQINLLSERKFFYVSIKWMGNGFIKINYMLGMLCNCRPVVYFKQAAVTFLADGALSSGQWGSTYITLIFTTAQSTRFCRNVAGHCWERKVLIFSKCKLRRA